MRTAYIRTSRNPATAKKNILICIGFGLVLILNATSAETTGISAMGLAFAKPFERLARHSPSQQDPLSASDARHYQLAFSAIWVGHWEDAETEANRASDNILRGEVLAARYLSPDYKPDYAELSSWLVRYSDLPDAPAIRHRAGGMQPEGMALPAPSMASVIDDATDQSVVRLPGIGMLSKIKLTGHYEGTNLKAVNRLAAALSSHLRDDAAVTARRVLATSPAASLLEEQDIATIKAHVAASLLYEGETETALQLAAESLSAHPSDEARWTAGLAGYRLERYEAARDNFTAIAKSAFAEPWTSSAASFWAARACEKLNDAAEADRWLDNAASYRGTFYGMLAERTRGMAMLAAPSHLQEADIASIASVPAGRRALALMQIGQAQRAEANLRQIDVSAHPALRGSLTLYAWRMNLPDLAQRIGAGLTGDEAAQAGRGAYPTPLLQPRGGFTTDPALVYAITRQESRFDTKAESDAGAVGLMQIMPQTAAAISSSQGEVSSGAQLRQAWKQKLRDPVTNVELGQRYIQMLLASNKVSGNLLLMAAAYNSGPGNLTRWRGAEIDPLMFLETLPAAETRGFIEQVMTNYWIYQLEMKAEPVSLFDLAAGKWPLYKPLAPKPVLMADRN